MGQVLHRLLCVLGLATLAWAGPASMVPYAIPPGVSTTTLVSTSTTTTTTTTTLPVWPAKDDFNRVETDVGPGWTTGFPLYPDPAKITVPGNVGCLASKTCVAGWKAAFPQTATYACGRVTWQSGDTASLVGVCVGNADERDLACCFLNQGWVSMQVGTAGAPLAEVVRAASAFTSNTYVGIVRTSATAFQCFTATDGKTWTSRGTAQTVPNVVTNSTPGFAVMSLNKYLTMWEAGLGALPTTRTCGGP